MIILISSGCADKSTNNTESNYNDSVVTVVPVNNTTQISEPIKDSTPVSEPVNSTTPVNTTNQTSKVISLADASKGHSSGGGSSGGSSGGSGGSKSHTVRDFSTSLQVADVAGRGSEGVINDVGEAITYQLIVRNIGNTNLTDPEIHTYPETSPVLSSESLTSDGILNDDEIWTYTFSYVVTEKDLKEESYRFPMVSYIDFNLCDEEEDTVYASIGLTLDDYYNDYRIVIDSNKSSMGFSDDTLSYNVTVVNEGRFNLTDVPLSINIESETVVENLKVNVSTNSSSVAYSGIYTLSEDKRWENCKDVNYGSIDIVATSNGKSAACSVPMEFSYYKVNTGVKGEWNEDITLVFINNNTAVDPTYAQMEDLLRDEPQAEYLYELFNSGGFYESDATNFINAYSELVGYRCGMIDIKFDPILYEGEEIAFHAFMNVFNTTDSGLVYTDSSIYTYDEESNTLQFYSFQANVQEDSQITYNDFGNNETIGTYTIGNFVVTVDSFNTYW